MTVPGFFVTIISTFFFVGYLPFIPGTFGSLAGLAVFFAVKDYPVLQILLTGVVVIMGFLFSGKAERLMNKKDCRCIVIDEVSGMLLSLLFIPYDARLIIIGFFLFRAFDSLKPYPISRLEKLGGSLGIMCDDIAAGLYTNLILQVVFRVASFRAS